MITLMYLQYCVLYKQIQHFTAGEEKMSRELKFATENEAKLQVINHLRFYSFTNVLCGSQYLQKDIANIHKHIAHLSHQFAKVLLQYTQFLL